MIKIIKNNVPLKEFYSIYNAIEYLQGLFMFEPPDTLYPSEKKAFFKIGEDTYELEVEVVKQMTAFTKWAESFINKEEVDK